MKKFIIIFFVIVTIISAQDKTGPVKPGAFARMGYGARGTAMGNAMSAVTSGNLVSYYNPALGAFQEGNSFYASSAFLSLDRNLNFLNFTRKFVFGSPRKHGKTSTAGLSAGIINSGVDGIDGRDNSGMKTGELSTSENQFFLAFSNRFSGKFTIGVGIKFYYYDLYEGMTANGMGFDIGLLYNLDSNTVISAVITDLNSSYTWDSTELYDQDGTTSNEDFATLKKVGLAHTFEGWGLLASAEFESAGSDYNYLRFGAEYNIYERLYLRAGLDKFNLEDTGAPSRPGFGFAYYHLIDGIELGVDYAFVLEPYSEYDRHILGLNINF